MLGGGWGRLGAAGGKGGGQRRRRRRGEFGLNTGIFSPKLFFGACRLGGELQVRCGCCGRLKPQISPTRKKTVTCFPPLQPAQWQRSGSAVAAQWKRSGSAADAQRPGGLKPLYCELGGGGERVRARTGAREEEVELGHHL